MNRQSILYLNCINDEVDYLTNLKYSDTAMVLADNLDPVPLLMPSGACKAATNIISAYIESSFISSPSHPKEAPWRSDNGQTYCDVPRDGITIYNKEQEGKFFTQEIIVNALFDKL